MAGYRESLSVRITGSTETVVLEGQVVVHGVHANVGSSGTGELRDAAAIGGGSTPIITFDATAGVTKDFFGRRCFSGLTYKGSAAGSDVTIFYDRA